MTAPQPATPGSDSPTPGMETHRMLAGSHEQPGGAECRCGAPWDRWNDTCTQAAAPSPVDTTEPPAETLRDDDHEPYANAYEWEPVAARPPADTETLPTSVDQLTRAHFGKWVDVPDRQAGGYLYVVRDEFHDGYPSRYLVLVADDGAATELGFTDSDPAGYPKTMRTPCTVRPTSPPQVPGQLILDAR